MQRCEYLQRDALEQVNPHISKQFQEAIYFPELSNIRNPRVLQSLISYLKQHPNVEFLNTLLLKMIQQGDVIQALQTEDGRKYTADHFVITSGAWSHYWNSQLQLEIPVEPVQGQMLLFKTLLTGYRPCV